MPPFVDPMLALSGPPTQTRGTWIAEPKLDGWRAQVAVDPEQGVQVRTRRGRSVSVPEMGGLVDVGVPFVLDGELVVEAGTAEDFYAVGPTLARRAGRKHPVTFAAFDVLWVDGHSTVTLPYRVRRKMLETLELPTPAVVVRAWPADDVDDLLVACEHLGVEGLVLKDIAAPYLPGKRSGAWRKVKCASWRSDHLARRRPTESART